jgi:hypothetical protein
MNTDKFYTLIYQSVRDKGGDGTGIILTPLISYKNLVIGFINYLELQWGLEKSIYVIEETDYTNITKDNTSQENWIFTINQDLFFDTIRKDPTCFGIKL